MNPALKSALMTMAAAAFGVAVASGCGNSDPESPSADSTAGGEAAASGEGSCGGEGSCKGEGSCSGKSHEEAAPAPAAGGEGSCGEGSCS